MHQSMKVNIMADLFLPIDTQGTWVLFHGDGYVIREAGEGQEAHLLQKAQRVGRARKR